MTRRTTVCPVKVEPLLSHAAAIQMRQYNRFGIVVANAGYPHLTGFTTGRLTDFAQCSVSPANSDKYSFSATGDKALGT